MSENKEVTNTRNNTGCVKWFNNKTGFGFITIIKGEHLDQDIFVHHTGINVSSEQYRYLVRGEYVELDIEETSDDKHKFKAVNISGICGGKLMCETKNMTNGKSDE